MQDNFFKSAQNQLNLFEIDDYVNFSLLEWKGVLATFVGDLEETSFQQGLIDIASLTKIAHSAFQKKSSLQKVEDFYRQTMGLLFANPSNLNENTTHYIGGMFREDRLPYHNYLHVASMIKVWKDHLGERPMPCHVRLAILFHDYVYRTDRTDNESASIQEMRDQLNRFGEEVPSDIVESAERLIESTILHQPIEQDGWDLLFLDLDLSILGSGVEEFRHYEESIRKEYGWVEEEVYRTERRRIMNELAEREDLFFSPELRAVFEEPARRNLSPYLTRLPYSKVVGGELELTPEGRSALTVSSRHLY